MRCLLGLSLCAIAICGAAATVRADDDEKKQQTERKPEIEAVIVVDVNGDGVDGGAVSSHWLGVFATPVEGALKAQLNLDSGFVVREVVAKSPAEAAGLQQHDIIKSYAGAKLVGDDDLIDAIKKHGGKSADLVVLRGGKTVKLTATPEMRPARQALRAASNEAHIRALIKQLGDGESTPQNLFLLGPGIDLKHAKKVLPSLPNTSISISKENNEPAKITVKRNGKTWTVSEDDLGKLPEDVRKAVTGHLKGGRGAGISIGGDVNRFVLPFSVEGFPGQRTRVIGPKNDDALKQLQEDMKRLHKQLDQLQKQFENTRPRGEPRKSKKSKKSNETDKTEA